MGLEDTFSKTFTKALTNAQRLRIGQLEAENAKLRTPSLGGTIKSQAVQFLAQNGVQMLTFGFELLKSTAKRPRR
jgi:hypothetical protein